MGATIAAINLLPLNQLFRQAVSQPSSEKPKLATNVINPTNSKVSIPTTNTSISSTVAQWRGQTKALILSLSIPSQYQGKVFEEVKIKANPKVIALTFDDGPWLGSTDEILQILRRNNVKATFFIIGRNLQLYPQIGQQIVSEGHAIANHTWSHSYHHFSPTASAREIEATTNLIYKLTGVKTYLFRPPGGFLNNGPAGYARNKKYAVVLWSADSNDWKRPSVANLVNNVVGGATPGGIALMHDGGGDRSHTIKALPIIIARLRSKGYSFVTIPELLELGNQLPPQDQVAKSMLVKSSKRAIASRVFKH
ncbi:polysaccharide deacetylase [Merismopedia glauca CCAP 1448/3]|uniref:Polysaccharide deacetylase n=2 Tax=Merismopedia TaxID=53402 RepID=A0A2T1C6T7_9CYAN|nr:polysaccharide deacetylase [Merismopedia glauca CCAP 1448/3]